MADLFDRAAQQGVELARRIVRETQARDAAVRAGTRRFGGYLILEGDSWFDYPFFKDIAESLKKDYSYQVKSAARHGHTAEAMAYIPKQLEEVHDLFKELADERKKARAILLSCGGNDFVGVFDAVLNHKHPDVPPLNASVLAGQLREEIPRTIVHLVSSIVTFSDEYFKERRPILIHGYAHPVPDGRDYPILGMSGPWLQPVFVRKGYVSSDPQPPAELRANTKVMAELIRYFNEVTLPLVITEVKSRFGDVVVPVDLRSDFSNDLAGNAYQKDWRDEMHGTAEAYERAAARIDRAIQQIPIP